MKFKTTVSILLLCLSFGVQAQMDREEDIEYFVRLMSSENWAKHKEAAQLLEWAGLSDPRVFDLVEKELMELQASTGKKGNDYDLIAWLLKALSFSGQSQYYDTVSKLAKESNSDKVRKYARQSLEQFSKYEKWNPIINSTENYNKDVSPEFNRFANMLRSSDFELKRLAAKRIHYDHLYNDYLLKELAASVESGISHNFQNGLEVDSMAWMCKALAGSRSQEYKPLIEKVAKTAKNSKVKSYAKKYLGYYK